MDNGDWRNWYKLIEYDYSTNAFINTGIVTNKNLTLEELNYNNIGTVKADKLVIPGIKKVIFNTPATIVLWDDGSKTVVKSSDENYDPEKGLAMAISKKSFGNKGNYYNIFKKWLPEYVEQKRFIEQIIDNLTSLSVKFRSIVDKEGEEK